LFVPDCREYVSEEFSGPDEKIVDWGHPLASLPANCEFTKKPETHRGRGILRNDDGSRVVKEQVIKTADGVEQTLRAPDWGEEKDYESGWIKFPPDHGFIAGCVWGDDSTWKIQYLDLSRVEEGIIRREERFGFIELPRSVLLRDAIDVEDLDDTGQLSIAISTRWNLLTGKMDPLNPGG
jgi:hypothetical protein